MKLTDIPETDLEFEDRRIESIDLGEDSGFTLHTDLGSLYVHNPENVPVDVSAAPRTVRFYGRGFGFSVRGVVIGERVYYYETAEEYEARRQREAEAEKARRVEEWEANYPETSRRVDALPMPFRLRMANFEAKPGWGPEFGPYELMVCEQAAKLAAKLETVEAIQAYAKEPWKRQREVFPEVDKGHSGNSHGAMVSLAILYLTQPELVPKQHGALCPLVGCEDYGCYAARQKGGE